MQPSCGQSEPSDDEVIPSLSCNTRLVTAVWEMRVDHNTTVAVGKACWKPINDIHMPCSIAFSHYHMPNPYHVMNKPCDNGTFYCRVCWKDFSLLEEYVLEQSPIT